MAPAVSREASIATAVVASVAVVAGVGYLYREKTQEVARSTYAAVSAQASAAATKGAEVAKALQESALATTNSVSSSMSIAWENVTAAVKKAKNKRTLRRVRSFPIVADVEDDVAAGKDQRKRAKAVKKATQEAERMGVPVQVMAK